MASLTLTEQEGNVLIQLLDAAVKAQGLGVAENAVFLVKKVQEAFNPGASTIPDEITNGETTDGTDDLKNATINPLTDAKS